MKILLGLLPALIWGFTPVWANRCGGKPIQQLVGTTYGAFLAAVLVMIIKRPPITMADFGWNALAGAAWSFGQLMWYSAFPVLGVAVTNPIASGIQLIGVNLVGVAFFGSWPSSTAKLLGGLAILLILGGVYLTSRTGKSRAIKDRRAFLKSLFWLLVGSGFGFVSCSTLPKIPKTSGWSAYPPQALGMALAAVVFALLINRHRIKSLLFGKITLKNIVTGVNSGTGTLCYLISLMINGVSTGFTLSQMAVVVSTFNGIVILHEHKTKRQMIYTLSGLALVVVGGIITGLLE